MSNLNKSNYCFVLIKKKKSAKIKQIDGNKSFTLALCIKKRHNKFFVLEKIGSLNLKNNFFFINFFRFIYLLRLNPGFSSVCWKVLYKYIFKNISALNKI